MTALRMGISRHRSIAMPWNQSIGARLRDKASGCYFRDMRSLSGMRQHLDLAAVEAFVMVAELRSFTLASDALGMTQAGVSLKVRRLEAMMGKRLLDRTPRHVRLSTEGEAFLPLAQDLLAAQQSALEMVRVPGRELNIAISDHVAGPELPEIIARVYAHDPGLLLKVRVDFSTRVRKAFEQGDLDVAVIRQGARRDGDLLFEDPYGWFASTKTQFGGKPLPLITVVETCGVRALAIQLLVRSNVSWVDAFKGGGVATAISAAAAGIGVLPLPRRLAPAGLVEVGDALRLPALPPAKVAMLTRHVDSSTRATVRTLRSAFRASVL
ncbi:MAG: LysR family transcriptional regulator [Acidovorax sp.]